MSNCVDNNSNNKGARLLTLRQKRNLGRVTTCYVCDSCGGNAQNRYSGELTGVVRIATDELSVIFNALLWLVLLELTIHIQ